MSRLRSPLRGAFRNNARSPFAGAAGGAPAAWVPADVTGLKLYLDPDDDTTLTMNGGDVARINDKSAAGSDWEQTTAALQPELVDVVGAKGSLLFKGATLGDEFMDPVVADPNAGMTEGHQFITMRTTNETGLEKWEAWGSAVSNNWHPGIAAGLVYEQFASTRAGVNTGDPTDPIINDYCWEALGIAGEFTCRQNGNLEFTDAVNTVGFSAIPTLGHPSYKGNMGMRLMYDSKLTGDDLANVYAFITQERGITFV